MKIPDLTPYLKIPENTWYLVFPVTLQCQNADAISLCYQLCIQRKYALILWTSCVPDPIWVSSMERCYEWAPFSNDIIIIPGCVYLFRCVKCGDRPCMRWRWDGQKKQSCQQCHHSDTVLGICCGVWKLIWNKPGCKDDTFLFTTRPPFDSNIAN